MLENASKYWNQFTVDILSHGPIPQHIAFIMDGNRRFAKKKQVDDKTGHSMGFDTLQEILELSLMLGVKEVSIYAFSIENFKRPQSEVTGLMELAKEKFTRMMQENDMIDKLGISVRVAGDLSLVPPDVLQAITKAVHYSRNNTRAILNVCFSYTAQEEMVHSLQAMAFGVQNEQLKHSDITENLFEKCMYIPSTPDILVRTSGEIRLSDFMLWQASQSCLIFLKELWPDFSLWCFFKTIVTYQTKFILAKREYKNPPTSKVENTRQQQFLTTIKKTYTDYIQRCSQL